MTGFLFDNSPFLMLAIPLLQVLFCAHVFTRSSPNGVRRDTIRRLEAYARLRTGEYPKSSGEALSVHGHQVLLGTIKKVETKIAVIVTILVFALTIFLGVMNEPGAWDPASVAVVLLAESLFIPLLLSLISLRQLDLEDCRRVLSGSDEQLARKLEDDLLRNLVFKERAFRCSLYSIIVSLLTYILVIFVDASADLIFSP